MEVYIGLLGSKIRRMSKQSRLVYYKWQYVTCDARIMEKWEWEWKWEMSCLLVHGFCRVMAIVYSMTQYVEMDNGSA